MDRAHGSGALATAWASARERSWMHRRLRLNDPDSVYLSAHQLRPEQARGWLDLVAFVRVLSRR
jgi:hypothetical protein